MDAPALEQTERDDASVAYEPPTLTAIGTIEELTLVEVDDLAGASGGSKPT